MTKMRSAYSSSTPIPLSVHGEAPEARRRARRRASTRGGSVAAELDRVGDQVLEHGGEQAARRPRRTGRSSATTSPPDSSSADASRPRACATSVVGVDALVRRGHPPDAREVEQVVDQLLHPLGAVDRERDVAVGALVELALVAALEHLGEARDLAQRLLQVVRGDVGELLELLVGALQLARLLDQRPLRVAQRGELGDDPLAHRLDVGSRARRSRAAPTRSTGRSKSSRATSRTVAASRASGRMTTPRRSERGRGDREQDEQARADEHRARRAAPRRRAPCAPRAGWRPGSRSWRASAARTSSNAASRPATAGGGSAPARTASTAGSA